MKLFLYCILAFAWLVWASGVVSDLILLFSLKREKKEVYQRLECEQQDFLAKGLPVIDFGWGETFQKYIGQTQNRLLYYTAMLAGLGILTLTFIKA